MRSDTAIMQEGEAGSSAASALCQVACLPADMAEWNMSTDQGVIDNLHRGLMMVSSVLCLLYVLRSK